MLTVLERASGAKLQQFSLVSCKAAFNSCCSTSCPLGQIKLELQNASEQNRENEGLRDGERNRKRQTEPPGIQLI